MTLTQRCALPPLSICLIVIATFVRDARAAPVTFAFRGTVNRVDNFAGFQQGSVPAVGDTFDGTYTFDPVAAPPHPFGGRQGGRLEGAVGNLRWTADQVQLSAGELPGDAGEDVYEVWSGREIRLLTPPPIPEFIEYWDFFLTLRGTDALLDGSGLPAVPPDLAFATGERTLMLWGDSVSNLAPFPLLEIDASLDALTLVPEPTALAPILAMAAILLRSRRPPRPRRPSNAPAGSHVSTA